MKVVEFCKSSDVDIDPLWVRGFGKRNKDPNEISNCFLVSTLKQMKEPSMNKVRII